MASTSPSSPSGAVPNAHFVLLAEFDIDKGSVLRMQFPRETGVEPSRLAELMLPEGAHLFATDGTVFFLSQADVVVDLPRRPRDRDEFVDDEDGSAPMLHVVSVVRTKKDAAVRRGAVVKAMALCTIRRDFSLFKPLLGLALDAYFEAPPEEVEGVLRSVYEAVNAIEFPKREELGGVHTRLLRAARLRLQTHSDPTMPLFAETTVTWRDAVLPLRVPLCLDEDETLDCSLVALVRKFGADTMKIFTAVLCEKRVLFVGHHQPSRETCAFALTASMLVSPHLFGLLRRTFPYINLTDLQVLEKPGYIAGATNPVFKGRTKWWDIYCDTSTGEVKLSPSYASMFDAENDPSVELLHEFDAEFMQEIIAGIGHKFGEEWVRSRFRDLTARLMRTATGDEQFHDRHEKRRFTDANRIRLDLVQHSHQFDRYVRHQKWLVSRSPFRAMDSVIRTHVRALQVRPVDDEELAGIFKDFIRYVQTDDELREFLTLLPESRGGLYVIAVALFNQATTVRDAAVELLRRLDDGLPEGRSAVSSLNYFLLLTFNRLLANSKEQEELARQQQQILVQQEEGQRREDEEDQVDPDTHLEHDLEITEDLLL